MRDHHTSGSTSSLSATKNGSESDTGMESLKKGMSGCSPANVNGNEKGGERRELGKVVAVDPVGSILGGGEDGHYEVEGIG